MYFNNQWCSKLAEKDIIYHLIVLSKSAGWKADFNNLIFTIKNGAMSTRLKETEREREREIIVKARIELVCHSYGLLRIAFNCRILYNWERLSC